MTEERQPNTCKELGHSVNPETDRCTRCGKNRWNREREERQPNTEMREYPEGDLRTAQKWLLGYTNSQRAFDDRNLQWKDIEEDALFYGLAIPELLVAFAASIQAEARQQAAAHRSLANKANDPQDFDPTMEALEIHNRFCGENGEPCQVCRLKTEREKK